VVCDCVANSTNTCEYNTEFHQRAHPLPSEHPPSPHRCAPRLTSPPVPRQFYEKWFGMTVIQKKVYSDFSLYVELYVGNLSTPHPPPHSPTLPSSFL
jgi:hypothetical protein